MARVTDFPLFPLGLVALPSEVVPLHVFEDRYKALVARVLADGDDGAFGIVWVADDGLKDIGCAVEIAEVLDRLEDGRLNILCRGTRPFRITSRQEDLPYPAGTVEWLQDEDAPVDAEALAEAQEVYAELVRRATDQEPDPLELSGMGAYEMAATVDFGLEAKQSLLELRSEPRRLEQVTRLFRAATKRLEYLEKSEVLAKSNGKVRF